LRRQAASPGKREDDAQPSGMEDQVSPFHSQS
jgi:hypothetical protein